MSDSAEVWTMLRANRRDTNTTRYERCVAQMHAWPYRVAIMNNGVHWRVEVEGVEYDFWPQTGRWMNPRKSKENGRVDDFNAFIAVVSRGRIAA